jgi:hypothetical protein
MFHNLCQKIYYRIFDSATKYISNTPPIQCDPSSQVACVSQVCHRDIYAYLIAIKSFTRFLVPNKIYVVDDLSLTIRDRTLITEHINDVRIVPLSEIETHQCPSGGTWERLLLISDCVKDDYVIQVDSDTLTMKDISEIQAAVEDNRSFILGTWKEQKIEPMKKACENVISVNSQHVQMLAEKNLCKLSNYKRLYYVRGCSAFAGFPRGELIRGKIQDFSRQMEEVLGTKWHDWGSEQVTSNFVVANCCKSSVLPFPKYAGFRPGIQVGRSSFLHFSGTFRFKDSVYIKLAKQVLAELRNGH